MCGLAFAYQVQGQDTQAREAARSLLAWVQDQHNMGELMSTYALQGQLALLQDRVEEAQHWLELAGEQETLGPMFFFEDPLIIRARMHIARGDGTNVARGQALLTHLLQHVEAIHSTRKTIKVLALQAWAYDVQGRGSEALALLERALVMGRPGGFIRTFADAFHCEVAPRTAQAPQSTPGGRRSAGRLSATHSCGDALRLSANQA